MRILATVLVAAMATTPALAMDLPIAGLELNTEVVLEHKVDAEISTLVATPELAYSPNIVPGLEMTAGIELSVWDNTNSFTLDSEFDVKPEILLGATYVPQGVNLELELATSYDFETQNRGEIVLTATYNF